jgi:hypothetical protein
MFFGPAYGLKPVPFKLTHYPPPAVIGKQRRTRYNSSTLGQSLEWEDLMKIIAVICLMLGMLLSSLQAAAEDPIPFSALEQSPGAQSAIPPAPEPQKQPSEAPVKNANHGPITTGGKAEIGIGIGLVGLGALFIAGGASVRNGDWFAGPTRAVGFGGGAVFAGSGITLIVLGNHRRAAKK